VLLHAFPVFPEELEGLKEADVFVLRPAAPLFPLLLG